MSVRSAVTPKTAGGVAPTALLGDRSMRQLDIQQFSSVGNTTHACPGCGEEYTYLGTHWRYSPDHRPELTARQHEVATGLLMGDGSILRSKENETACLQCRMITPEFLRWVDGEFGIFGLGVKFRETAEERAAETKRNGYSPNAEASDYSDVYQWISRKHPEFERYAAWYDSGKKQFPHALKLTPLILKIWYCCDGNKASEPRFDCRDWLRISSANEIENEEYLAGLFDPLGVDPTFTGDYIQFSADDSETLWKHMGDPLPGFPYKWPE